MAGHDDWQRVPAQRPTDGAGGARLAELARDSAVGRGHSPRDAAGAVVDGTREGGDGGQVELDGAEVDGLTGGVAGQLLDEPGDLAMGGARAGAEHLGAGWFDLVYDNKTNFREYAMRTARESLDTPEELRAEYLRHKAKVIAEIEKQGIQDYVVRCANIVRFHFSPDGEVFADPYTDRGAKEWAGRRRTEGGGALVAAWGEIIADLANSL